MYLLVVLTHAICSFLLASTMYLLVVRLQDFMYSPMRANLHSHSFSSCHSRTSSPDEVQHSTSREEPTNSSPARQLHFTQQHSSGNHHQPSGALKGNQPGAHTHSPDLSRQSSSASRRRSVEMPSSPYAGHAAQQGGSFSPTGASRRASFDNKPHSPHANHPRVLSSQRPSSTWTQQAPSIPPAAYVPHSNASPGRHNHRPAQSLHRQLSMRSNISSLPDIDELDSSFTSTGTEEDAPQPRTPPSPFPHSASARQSRYSPPAGQAQTLQGLFRQQSMMSSTPALPNIDEQPSTSAVKAAESSSVETQTEQGFPMPTDTAVHDAVLQTAVSTGQKAEESGQAERASDSEALTVLDDSPLQIPVLGVATSEAQKDAADAAKKGRQCSCSDCWLSLNHVCYTSDAATTSGLVSCSLVT